MVVDARESRQNPEMSVAYKNWSVAGRSPVAYPAGKNLRFAGLFAAVRAVVTRAVVGVVGRLMS